MYRTRAVGLRQCQTIYALLRNRKIHDRVLMDLSWIFDGTRVDLQFVYQGPVKNPEDPSPSYHGSIKNLPCIFYVFLLCIFHVFHVSMGFHRISMVCSWIIHRFSLDFSWIVHGFYMDPPCILHEIFMLLSWILHGISMDLSWILHGSCMYGPWIFHALLMKCSCLLNGFFSCLLQFYFSMFGQLEKNCSIHGKKQFFICISWVLRVRG